MTDPAIRSRPMPRTRFLPIGALAAALLALPAPAAAAPTHASTLGAVCVGGAIGCEQVAFTLALRPGAASAWLDFLTITLASPAFVFADPNIADADDALGPTFVSPIVSPDGSTLTAEFPFGAHASPTLVVRAQFATFDTDLSSLRATYVGGTLGDGEVASGALATSAVPEPATVVLLGAGLAVLAAGARRRRAG